MMPMAAVSMDAPGYGINGTRNIIASVTLAHRLVGLDNAATAQAVLGMMSFGFGSITGSVVAGALLDVVGTYSVFRGMAVLMVGKLAIFVIDNRVISLEEDDTEPA